MSRWLALLVALVGAAILGVLAAQPPSPLPATAPAGEFAAGRAMADVRAIASVPHSTGSPESAAVIAHLVTRLKALGFEVRTTTAPLPESARKRLRTNGSPYWDTASLTNIIALRPGGDPGAPVVALMAHHDSVWGSPGAADDAAGVAAALEIARAIPRQIQARDLAIIFTDAEELGLNGAKAFFAPGTAGDPLAARIGTLVNMETRGGGGRAFMFETSSDAGGLIDLYRQSVRQPSTTSMAVKLYELLPNGTDFTPARKRGIQGLNLAFTGKAWLYHSPLATPDNLDQGSLQHLGAQGLDLARALVTAPQSPAPAPDVVFGDILGVFTFAYAPALGWLLLAATFALVVLAARARRADWGWKGVGGGILDGLVFTTAAAVLLYAGNLVSGADAEVNYYDRLAALPRLEMQALLLFAAGIAIAIALLPRHRTLWEGWLGLAGLSLAVATTAQVVLPAAGAIFTLPLLLAAIAMLVAARAPGAGTVAATIVAIPALAWLGGLAHNIMLGIGTGTPSAAAAFAPLTLLLLWPLLPRLPRRPALLTALVLVFIAGGIAFWVRLDPVAASIPPYSDKR